MEKISLKSRPDILRYEQKYYLHSYKFNQIETKTLPEKII